MKTAQDFKKAREELKMTQKQLAEALGVARNYIYLIESGKMPVSKKLDTALDRFIQGNNFGTAHAENGGVVSFGEGSRIRTSPPHETIEAKLDLVLESFNALTATVERIAVALEKLAGK